MNIPHFPIVKKLLQPPSVNLVKAILNSRFTEQQCCEKTSEVTQSTFLIRTNALWNLPLTTPHHWPWEAQSSLLVLPSAALPTTTPTQCLLHLTEDNSPNVWRCLVLPSLSFSSLGMIGGAAKKENWPSLSFKNHKEYSPQPLRQNTFESHSSWQWARCCGGSSLVPDLPFHYWNLTFFRKVRENSGPEVSPCLLYLYSSYITLCPSQPLRDWSPHLWSITLNTTKYLILTVV